MFQIMGTSGLMFGVYSTGNLKLANHLLERCGKIRVDSEALDDQKCGAYQFVHFTAMFIKLAQWDADGMRDYFNKLFSLNKRFPNAKSTYPHPAFNLFSKRIMSCLAIYEGDIDSAESLIAASIAGPMSSLLIFPGNSHIDLFLSFSVYPVLALYHHKIKHGEDASLYKGALLKIRGSIEAYAKFIPGTFRCSGAAHIANITLALKDRPFADVFEKLEAGLAYAIELACLPLDILCLELEVAKWKGDSEKFKQTYNKCINVGHKFLCSMYKDAFDLAESGELNAVDLTFVPEVVEPILTDEEKLEKLKEDLKTAKAEVKAANATRIKEQVDAARANARACKVALKEFEKFLKEKAKPVVDQARIDELKAMIVDAEARQEQAFDDDDEEAEEAASAEILKLGNELDALMAISASIPKQKLEDAKKTDAEINK